MKSLKTFGFAETALSSFPYFISPPENLIKMNQTAALRELVFFPYQKGLPNHQQIKSNHQMNASANAYA